jgi:uncharacterized protein (TIGR03067 family)
MRTPSFLLAAISFVLTAPSSTLTANSSKEAQTDRIARLIKQLGDDSFAKREAASKELDDIGEPALAALSKAATAGDDAEVRQRAARIHQSINERLLAAANKADLEKLQGTWIAVSHEAAGQSTRTKDDTSTITFTGDKWVTKIGDAVAQSGTFAIVDAKKSPKSFNFTSIVGGNATGYAIYAFDGDTFKYCAQDAGPTSRPNDFATKAGDGRYFITWKKAKK